MSDQQNDGFIRQRRNLMIVSLVLLFSEATELKVEKISAFGNELLIGHPQAVTSALWIAALYWLLRYYQYARPQFPGVINKAIHERLFNTCGPAALKKILRDEKRLLDPFSDVAATPELGYSIMKYFNEPGSFEVVLKLEKFASNREQEKVVRIGMGERTVRFSSAESSWLRIKAWSHAILHTTVFTELVLPYIVFALPVLYAGYKVITKYIAP